MPDTIDQVETQLEAIFQDAFTVTRGETGWIYEITSGAHLGYLVEIVGTGLTGDGDAPDAGSISAITITDAASNPVAHIEGLTLDASDFADTFGGGGDSGGGDGFSTGDISDLFENAFTVDLHSDTQWHFVISEGPLAGYAITVDGSGLTGDGDIPTGGTVDSITVENGATLVGQLSGLGFTAAQFAALFENDVSEHLHGGSDDDEMHGGIGDDDLGGGDGDDSLDGGDGSDSLDGGLGDDDLTGGDGLDTLQGGSGHDTLSGGANDDDLDGGADDDTVDYSGAAGDMTVNLVTHLGSGVGEGTDHLSSIEDITGSSHNDSLTGDEAANQLDGGSGGDDLNGGAGDDDLNGGTGNDDLNGGANDDDLSGGTGLDTLMGASGDDTLGGGGDRDKLSGGLGDDSLSGDGGNDNLDGGADDDHLSGGTGNDALAGGTGNDTASGGAGADDIDGGDGKDVLTGGTEDDNFVFTHLGDIENDVITDFHAGHDDIDLSALDANGSAKGNGTFHFLTGEGDHFTHHRGELRWVETGAAGHRYDVVQGDINGDGKADFQITLNGTHHLHTGDFVL